MKLLLLTTALVALTASPAQAAVPERPTDVQRCAAADPLASAASLDQAGVACHAAALTALPQLLAGDRWLLELTAAFAVASGATYAACQCDVQGMLGRIRQQVQGGATAVYRWFASPGPRDPRKSRGLRFLAGCSVAATAVWADRMIERPGINLNKREWWKVATGCISGGTIAAWRL